MRRTRRATEPVTVRQHADFVLVDTGRYTADTNSYRYSRQNVPFEAPDHLPYLTHNEPSVKPSCNRILDSTDF